MTAPDGLGAITARLGVRSHVLVGDNGQVSDASRLIAAAAKDALAPIGLIRKGRSRCWIDDHGWWLVNVEFQPSSYGPGCYLNIGEQHLWIERSYLVFEQLERPLGGSRFVHVDPDTSTSDLQDVGRAAAEAVELRRKVHGEGVTALQRLAQLDHDDLNAGIAAALLGRSADAARLLMGQVHEAFEAQSADYSAVLSDGASDVARFKFANSRERLGLPVTDLDFPF